MLTPINIDPNKIVIDRAVVLNVIDTFHQKSGIADLVDLTMAVAIPDEDALVPLVDKLIAAGIIKESSDPRDITREPHLKPYQLQTKNAGIIPAFLDTFVQYTHYY